MSGADDRDGFRQRPLASDTEAKGPRPAVFVQPPNLKQASLADLNLQQPTRAEAILSSSASVAQAGLLKSAVMSKFEPKSDSELGSFPVKDCSGTAYFGLELRGVLS